jgi:hypothetical protein
MSQGFAINGDNPVRARPVKSIGRARRRATTRTVKVPLSVKLHVGEALAPVVACVKAPSEPFVQL